MAEKFADADFPDDHDEESDLESGLNTNHTYWCAFCGEENEVFVDGSGARRQQFTEDCTVCCRPNLLTITIGYDDSVTIDVEREYDA